MARSPLHAGLLSRRLKSQPLALLCLLLFSNLLLFSLPVALADECVVEPSAWVLLRFNLRSASGESALGSSSSQVQIEVDNSTVARLQAVTTKLAVISIIGPYRTGKSTLLNRLLPSNIPSYVFSVGHTVQPHTEEVSVYIIPPCALAAAGVTSLSSDTSLVLVDTPGLFAPNRVALFDAQLLAVLNLISSVVLYNNVGVIKLSDAVEAAFALSYYGDADPSAQIDRPHLIWCMQNLQVELKDRDGAVMSTKAYIQSVLNEIDATGNSSSSSASLSARFNRFFASLDSFALPFPSTNFKDAQRLSSMREEEFTAEYREEKDKLKARAMALVQAKKLGNNVLQGRMLAQLISTWTDNVNIPLDAARESSASSLMRAINAREVAKSLQLYKQDMRQLQLPVQDSELRAAHERAVQAAVQGMNTADLPDFLSLFQRETDALYTDYVKLNEGNVKTVLQERQRRAVQAFQEKVDALQSQLPLPASDIAEAEQAARAAWRKDTEALRTVGASVIGDFDMHTSEGLEQARNGLLQRSLAAFKARRKEELEQAMAALSLPVEATALGVLHKQHADRWAELQAGFAALLPKAATDADAADFASFSAERLSEWSQRNEQESSRACGAEALRLSREMLRDAEDWYHHPQLSSLSELNRHVRALKESRFCVGSGVKSEVVLFHFSSAKHVIAQQIAQRSAAAQAAYAVAALYALRAAQLLRRLLTEKAGSGTRGPELLGEKEALVANGRAAHSPARLSALEQCWLLASAVVAGLCLLLQRAIPDSAQDLWLHLLWTLIAALAAVTLVALTTTLHRAYGGAGKTSHEH